MQGHSHQTAWETGLIWQKSSAVFEFVCDDFMWKVAGSLRWWWCHQLHYIIILIWVYYWLLLILINQVNWLLLQFHSNKTLFICELTLWCFLFFPAFPCCICAHQVCQLAPAGPVGAGALHWLWENISAMAVLRLWVILKWAFYLWSYVLWTENIFVKSVWPSVTGMKMWVKWERSGLASSLCSLAFVFATHTYWVVLFVTKGHRYCRWQHSPWLAFGGLAVSA